MAVRGGSSRCQGATWAHPQPSLALRWPARWPELRCYQAPAPEDSQVCGWGPPGSIHRALLRPYCTQPLYPGPESRSLDGTPLAWARQTHLPVRVWPLLSSSGQVTHKQWSQREGCGLVSTSIHLLKIQCMTLAGVAQWIDRQPANQRVAGSIPSQSTCLGCGTGPH